MSSVQATVEVPSSTARDITPPHPASGHLLPLTRGRRDFEKTGEDATLGPLEKELSLFIPLTQRR